MKIPIFNKKWQYNQIDAFKVDKKRNLKIKLKS